MSNLSFFSVLLVQKSSKRRWKIQSKKDLPTTGSGKSFPINIFTENSKTCIVLAVTFKSMIHFELSLCVT